MSITFKRNDEKALEVVLWFANKEPGIDVHRLLKLLFWADKHHLNEYNRPIVGDNYCALQYGPVAMKTYDLLNKKPSVARRLRLRSDSLPFDIRGGNRKKHVWPKKGRRFNERKLSESDIDALEWAYRIYGHLDFDTLTRLTHAHPAWENGRKRPGHHIDFADLLEGEKKRDEHIDWLEEASRFIRA